VPAAAATRYSEGDKVVLNDDSRAIVVEVWTSGDDREGPGGDTYDASDSSPVYIVATEDGAEAVTASDLSGDDWTTDRDNPDEELADDVAASTTVGPLEADLSDQGAIRVSDDGDPICWVCGNDASKVNILPPYAYTCDDHGISPNHEQIDDVDVDELTATAARYDIDVEAGPADWDYPESWKEAETPARLILLDAWSSMGGQFSCGGGCCKGTMLTSGMSNRAANQFCASMKDRVLLWEGWRKGG
jgi:hypothetical protein